MTSRTKPSICKIQNFEFITWRSEVDLTWSKEEEGGGGGLFINSVNGSFHCPSLTPCSVGFPRPLWQTVTTVGYVLKFIGHYKFSRLKLCDWLISFKEFFGVLLFFPRLSRTLWMWTWFCLDTFVPLAWSSAEFTGFVPLCVSFSTMTLVRVIVRSVSRCARDWYARNLKFQGRRR